MKEKINSLNHRLCFYEKVFKSIQTPCHVNKEPKVDLIKSFKSWFIRTNYESLDWKELSEI
jgi:hypothetical protein